MAYIHNLFPERIFRNSGCEHALLSLPGLKTNRLGMGQDTMRSEYAPCLCERPHLSSGQR